MTTRIISILTAAIIAAVLATPAAAHTGSVTCDTRGVVFTYQANFERDTLVTETVGQAQRIVLIHARTASTSTWPGITGTITVGARWSIGSIPTVTLACPAAPPPPVVVTTPPPAPVAPPAPAIETPAAPPAPATPPAVELRKPAACPPKYKLHVTHGTRLCLRTITKPPKPLRCVIGRRVHLTGGDVCIVRVPTAPHPTKRGGAGVTG